MTTKTTKNEQQETHFNESDANDAKINEAFDRYVHVAELMVSGMSEWEARWLETSSYFEAKGKAGL